MPRSQILQHHPVLLYHQDLHPPIRKSFHVLSDIPPLFRSESSKFLIVPIGSMPRSLIRLALMHRKKQDYFRARLAMGVAGFAVQLKRVTPVHFEGLWALPL